jgi:PleD family two-component response regulator
VTLNGIYLNLNVTVSIGVAIAFRSGESNTQDAYHLIKQADLGLYQAKNSGRNCTCII